ncbi:MAG TPA: integron cassette protein [Phycisphaerales bacterium]|nr:integron cassette protein [Phycisphaerales bacterium]HCD30862.1 integron cassette protein [Phycisphaerales bacterium]|tara:strand:+ start:1027 stop:1287 length:261 start_codon:yes stop_codon:yes gene_type:complete
MKSSTHGNDTLATEVTNISSHGIWLLHQNTEYFLSYEQYPWFKDQPVKNIFNIEEPCNGHFHWPDLDVDLSVEILKNPEQYPLSAK